jgi:hypothetical protein
MAYVICSAILGPSIGTAAYFFSRGRTDMRTTDMRLEYGKLAESLAQVLVDMAVIRTD